MLIKIGNNEYSEAELETLNKAGVLNIAQKNDPASTTPSAQPMHGPLHGNTAQYGPFSAAGVRPQMFSALSRPASWLDIVALEGSDVWNEITEIMTGQLAGGTTNATGFCGNPPVPGWLKTCQQTYSFGKYYVKTDLNVLAYTGLRKNRADVPREILNAGPNVNPLIPSIMFDMSDTNNLLAVELFKIGNSLARTVELVSIQGTAGTDASRTGWWSEFGGLDGQIKTGYTDAVTGVTCPAVDSAVVSFNADVAGTAAGGDGRSLVAVVTETVIGLMDRARDVGMNNVQFAIVMRKEQFRRVVDVWSCNYLSYRCAGAQYAENNTNSADSRALQIEMIQGQYLLIDGMQIPVIFTEGIPNPAVGNAQYQADIFVVPVSWEGMPLIKLQYFDMNNPYLQAKASFTNADAVTVLNNGLFLVGRRDTGLCVEYHFQAMMRLILETPFLAGRIDDVTYTYRVPTRQAIPGSSLYADGGISIRLS